MRQAGLTRRPQNDGPTSKTIPPNPINRPSAPSQFGRTPPGRMVSMTAIHNGTEPIITAATPDGTCCSAKESIPVPPNNSSRPITAEENHCLFVGAGSPASRLQPYKIVPAMRNRVPAIKNGGIVLTAKWMAR